MTRNDIQKIIDEEINPGLAMHGGYISIHDFNEEHKSLKLTMGGGCHGCASSRFTMMMGVERHFKEAFPEIGEIEDVTDHLSGANPYYTIEE
jgi:Fe-S cluster biogenesis protein NfuA